MYHRFSSLLPGQQFEERSVIRARCMMGATLSIVSVMVMVYRKASAHLALCIMVGVSLISPSCPEQQADLSSLYLSV
ncbi:hypothetical protein CesoFtcFv8_005434 [Champsocephalus esox]|uniref:Uncharacterized protein n=2 Tax=Champsocephalus TaxID=52236 RepID=A0AAN8HW38_CHAGU|nr:hypothetical protein CesoFtcFv8_005434 [Champsocephalus esox]KAK5931174.1 hypothetical protein CgunFtcFv8_027345 [Champsocephalus gunnari]